MNCENFQELMNLYFDKMLDKEKEAQLFEHLNSCEDCRKEFEEIQKMIEMLNEEKLVELPEGYHQELLGKLKETKIKNIIVKQKKSSPWKKIAAAAASLLVFFIVGSMFFLGVNNKSTSDSSGTGSNLSIAQSNIMMESEETGEVAGISDAEARDVGEVSLQSNFSTMEDTENSETFEIDERKLIKNIYIDAEIKDLEETITIIKEITKVNGGYVEYYHSGSYTVSSDTAQIKNGSITIKIPKEKCEEVKEEIKSYGKVNSENENIEDITSQYVDIEGRLKAKRLEEQRLLEILEDCETVDDIIKVEERLGYIRSDLEAYESTIKNWDKLVEYSTITISLTESQDASIDKISSDFGTKIKDNFIGSINTIIVGMENTVLFAAKIFLPFIAIATVITIIVFIVKNILKKNKRNKNRDNLDEFDD